MNLDFTNTDAQTPISVANLYEAEDFIFKQPDSLLKYVATKFLCEIRRLQHELSDPQYLYSGRIHRNAILCRNADIDKLRGELKEKEKLIVDMQERLNILLAH